MTTMPGPVAITQGDACGIGPEIVARLFAAGEGGDAFVVGSADVLRRAVRAVGGALVVACIEAPADVAALPPGCLPVLEPDGMPRDLVDAPVGHVDARAHPQLGGLAHPARHSSRLPFCGRSTFPLCDVSRREAAAPGVSRMSGGLILTLAVVALLHAGI